MPYETQYDREDIPMEEVPLYWLSQEKDITLTISEDVWEDRGWCIYKGFPVKRQDLRNLRRHRGFPFFATAAEAMTALCSFVKKHRLCTPDPHSFKLHEMRRGGLLTECRACPICEHRDKQASDEYSNHYVCLARKLPESKWILFDCPHWTDDPSVSHDIPAEQASLFTPRRKQCKKILQY